MTPLKCFFYLSNSPKIKDLAFYSDIKGYLKVMKRYKRVSFTYHLSTARQLNLFNIKHKKSLTFNEPNQRIFSIFAL